MNEDDTPVLEDALIEEAPAAAAPVVAPAEEIKRKTLSSEQWLEIYAHIEYDTMKATAIAAKYGITPGAITQHLQKRIKDGKAPIIRASKKHLLEKAAADKVAASVGATVSTAVSTFATKRKTRIETTRESLYQMSAINQRALAGIQKGIHDKTLTPAACANDLKALRHSELLLKTMWENRFAILDIESDVDEAALPEMVFRDITQDEIDLVQKGDDDGVEIELPDTDAIMGEDEIVDEGGK